MSNLNSAQQSIVVNTVAQTDWDAFVAASPMGHFMQSYAWGEFQAAAGWRVDRLAMQIDGRIVSAASLMSRGVPVIGPRIFYAPRGPVFESGHSSVRKTFLRELGAFARARNGLAVRCDPYVRESDEDLGSIAEWIDTGQEWSFWNGPRFVLWLDLCAEEDVLLKAMDRNCQRDIRAGYKRNVDFTMGTRDDIPEFYQMLVSMSSTKGIAAHPESYYASLFDTLSTSCKVGLFFARLEGKRISTGMSIAFGDRAWLLYAASDKDYFKLRVNRNVQWEMIKWARDLGCSRYDFRGTGTGDPPLLTDSGFGVFEFKRSFGPTFTRLAGYFDIASPSPLYRLARFVEDRGIPWAYDVKVKLDALRTRSLSRPYARKDLPAATSEQANVTAPNARNTEE
jgi:peptidoglycan pentaglycine glycine transferase (the first glycine)